MLARPTLALLVLLCAALAGCGGGRDIPEPSACLEPRTFPPPPDNPRFAADAGPDYEVREGDDVFLDGSASLHLDGRPLEFHWDQLEGPCVALDPSDPAMPTFVVPEVPADGTRLLFRLVVESDGQHSAPDDAEVLVSKD